MNSFTQHARRLLMVILIAGLALSACTLQAPSTPPEPTATAGGAGGGGVAPADENATMAVVAATAAAYATETAVAMGGGNPATPAPNMGGPTLDPALAALTPTAPPPTPILTPTPAPPPGTSCPNPYTVKTGDWIYKIARECRVEPSALKAANPGINQDRISPGQKLNMPSAGATAVAPATPQACTGTHTVVTGENLFRIAYNCGLTQEELARFNGIPYPYTIYPGNVLKFP